MTPRGQIKQIVFLHGVGSSGDAMRSLGDELGLTVDMHFPDGPQAFDMGPGRQWFSVKDVTEASRPARVVEALPGFNAIVEGFGDPRGTLLIGFSQGAIMSLHVAAAGLPIAGVIALSGRLAGPVAARAEWPPVTLLHGIADPVMPPEFARATDGWLREAGAEPKLTLFDRLDHGIDGRVIAAIRMTVRAESM